MKPDRNSHDKDEGLRQRAEQYRASGSSPNSGPENPLDAQRLLQELEIHQIELEIQNLELQTARDDAEEAREIYQDLYDFAPVGYFTLSPQGSVVMANLTGAALLGLERGAVTGRPFPQWISPKHRPDFAVFLSGIFNGEPTASIELRVLKKGGTPFSADITAQKKTSGPDCRMMLTDLTRRKEAEKAEKRLKTATRSNRKLQKEVLHRLEVEATLETAREKLSESLEKSKEQRKELRNLSHALIHAQEDERRRISRELHDGIVQALVAIQYEFELLAQSEKVRSPQYQDQIARTQEILEGSIDLVHGFAFDLRPSALDNLGLGPALEGFAARFQEANHIPVTLDLCEDVESIENKERIMLYRVAQEAFNNVSSHANAQNVSIRIFHHCDCFRMEITDDGIGIDPEKPAPPTGEGRLGLVGMKERASMLGAIFSLRSKLGKYTTVCIDLPRHQKADHL